MLQYGSKPKAQDQEVQSELIELLLKSLRFSLIMSVIVALVTAFVMWDLRQHEFILLWVTCILFTYAARMLLNWRIGKTRLVYNDLEKAKDQISFGIYLTSILWGMAGWVLFPIDYFEYQLFLTFMIGGLAAVSLGAMVYYLIPNLFYISILILPLAIRFYESEISNKTIMSSVLVLYWLGLVVAATRSHRDIWNIINLKISNSKKSQQIASYQVQLDTVINSAPMIFFLLDPGGAFVLCEGAGLKKLGQRPGSYIGQSIFDIWGDYPEMVHAVHEALAGAEIERDIGMSERRFNAFLRPVNKPGAATRQVVGVALDVTEQKHSEAEKKSLREQLYQAQKMEALGQLSAGIAHDFNNILSAVTGFSHLCLLEAQKLSNRNLIDNLQEISAAGDRAADLVKKIANFGRLGTRRDQTSVNPNQVINETIGMLGPLLPKTIHIRYSPALQQVNIKFDATELQQCIMNLCINARDAIETTGSIDIELGMFSAETGICSSCGARFQGPFVQLTVRDSGAGMPENSIRRIFDPFYTSKEIGKGTGLGLSVVHGLIHKQGGHIVVESNEGRGTAFKLFFPTEPAPQSGD